MSERKTFLPTPEPDSDVEKIHPIYDPSEIFFRPEGCEKWYLLSDYTPGDENDRWCGTDWPDMMVEYSDGFIEAEKTPADLALEYFRSNPDLGSRPTKEAREHAQALITAALA